MKKCCYEVNVSKNVGLGTDINVDGSSQNPRKAQGMEDQKNADSTGFIKYFLVDDKKTGQ